ncbi:hypothetical protein QBC38DRAFT_377200, partial [Podospora fimiseda]
FLCGFFPPSIREVTLWNACGLDMRETMRVFAVAVADGRYPRLEEVVLERSAGPAKWSSLSEWYDVKEELGRNFGEAGVRFELGLDSGGKTPKWKTGAWSPWEM